MVVLSAEASRKFIREMLKTNHRPTNYIQRLLNPEKKGILDRDEKDYCIFCHTHKAYSEKYDAYYCPKCVYWLERICPDRSCMFCSKRPKYPDLKEEKEWNKKNKLR